MAASSLEQRLNSFIRSLQEQDILDFTFNQIRILNDDENPRFLIELISTFCEDAEKSIAEMRQSMNSTPVNFERLLAAIFKLKGSSSCIGGKQVDAACRVIRVACDNRNRERCVAAIQVLMERFNTLHERLNRVAQFERAILNERGKI